MQDIKEALLARANADTALSALLGATPADTRIYEYYQGDASVSVAQPAFITFANLAFPENFSGVARPTFSFVIWAAKFDVVEPIAMRLEALFHKRLFVTSIGRKLYTKRVHVNDTSQEQPNFAGKTVHYRVSSLELTT